MTNTAAEEQKTPWLRLQLLAVAGGLSWLGSTLTTFTVVLLYKDTYGPIGISVIFLSMAVPTILVAPWAGVLADRFSTRALVPPLMVLMGLSSLTLTFGLPAWWAPIALAITAAAGTPVGASLNVVMAKLATPTDLPRVSGLLQASSSLGSMFGPALAGLLVATTKSYTIPFLIDAFSFWVLAAAMLVLGISRPGVVPEQGEKLKAGEGIRFILHTPLIRSLVILLAVLILCISVIGIGEVFLVMNVLKADAFTYGIVSAAFALGSLIGASATVMLKVEPRRHPGIVVAAISVLSVTAIVISLAWHWAVVAVVWLIAGVANAILNTYGVSMLLTKTPDETRGRVMAALNAVFSISNVVSMLLGGILIGIFTVRPVFMVAGILATVMLLILAPAVIREGRKSELAEA
jgi:MFS family permease